MSSVLLWLAAVGGTWTLATAALAPGSLRVAAAAAAVLFVPGFLFERALGGEQSRAGVDLGAPARWLTLSVGIAALAGLATTVAGGNIDAVLASLAVISVLLAVVVGVAPPRASLEQRSALLDERLARLALCGIAGAAALLAAAGLNIARDRMWYLAFIADLASGRTLDWAEPFLGTGSLAPRFAHNGWLVAVAAWTRLAERGPALVFERLAPPLLSLITASAAWQLATRLLPSAPGLAALSTVAVLATTRYPFFSPDAYAFFARLAEDKIVALLVFVPVTLAAIADVIDRSERARGARWLIVALALVAVGLSHPLVLMLLGIALVALLPLSFSDASLSPSRVIALLTLAAVLALLPAKIGLLARARIVETDDPAAAWSEEPTHPVVRAHLRMQRLRELPAGGPIVEPRLVAEPLLLLGLLGVPFAWARRRSTGGALLIATSLPFLALAFVPGIAPAFGRVVLPWMAYRALWMVPFGCLFAIALSNMIGGGATRAVALRSVGVVAIATLALAALPWERLRDGGPRDNITSDPDRAALLDAISALPATARIAAAPGLAELIPAFAAHPVLAFSDRGTVVFAGGRSAGERRLAANAAIVGLAPGNPLARRRLARAHGVTHAVLDGAGCGRLGEQVFRHGELRLCRVHASRQERSPALSFYERGGNGRPQVAGLEHGLDCTPTPSASAEGDPVFRWKRDSRWSARVLAIDCRAHFVEPLRKVALRVTADLPHAVEALVFRATVKTASGKRLRHHGMIELDRNDPVVVALSGTDVVEVRLRLAPAYLPYLNLRDLSLLE